MGRELICGDSEHAHAKHGSNFDIAGNRHSQHDDDDIQSVANVDLLSAPHGRIEMAGEDIGSPRRSE